MRENKRQDYSSKRTIAGSEVSASERGFYVREFQFYNREPGQTNARRELSYFALMYVGKSMISIKLNWPDRVPRDKAAACGLLTTAIGFTIAENGKIR